MKWFLLLWQNFIWQKYPFENFSKEFFCNKVCTYGLGVTFLFWHWKQLSLFLMCECYFCVLYEEYHCASLSQIFWEMRHNTMSKIAQQCSSSYASSASESPGCLDCRNSSHRLSEILILITLYLKRFGQFYLSWGCRVPNDSCQVFYSSLQPFYFAQSHFGRCDNLRDLWRPSSGTAKRKELCCESWQ